MGEHEIVLNTTRPNTAQTLLRDFKALGIHSGDIVMVHSAMSSIGWVCGAERAVVDALLAAVGSEGTLCMPAHSGENSDPADWANPPVPKEWFDAIYANMPPYDPQITSARGMGRIAELFRKYPGTLRSDHPHVSFTANGKHALEITKEHPLTPQFGPLSPLGKMAALKGKVLLLGTGYDHCTCFHMGEITAGIPKKRMGAAIISNGERIWQWFDDHEYDSEDFDRLGADFEKVHNVITGKAGNAECKLFDLASAAAFAGDWIIKNRRKA